MQLSTLQDNRVKNNHTIRHNVTYLTFEKVIAQPFSAQFLSFVLRPLFLFSLKFDVSLYVSNISDSGRKSLRPSFHMLDQAQMKATKLMCKV